MAIPKTENRIPGGFTLDNARVLGHAALNGNFCLVSYLPETIRFGDPVERIINRYVLFVDGSQYPDSTVFSYTWTIDYLTETGATLNSFAETDPEKQQGIYDFNSKNIDLDLTLLPAFKKLRVKCRVTEGANAVEVVLEHLIAEPFQDIADLYAKNEEGAEPVARGGNPYATQVAANFYRDHFQYNPVWNNEGFDIPMNIPLSILYHRVARSGKRRNVYHKFNSDYHEALNEDLLELFKQNRKNLVGPNSVKPHLLSMTLEETTFIRIGENGPPEEEDLFEAYNDLSEEEKTDIYNYARFPKSNFLVCALTLENLLIKAQEETYCVNYLGSDEEQQEWKDVAFEDLKDYPGLIKNWLDEYVDGPQTLIRNIDYKRNIGKVHKHAWAGYIEQILKYSYADKTNAPRITDVYFARKVVTESNDGALSVRFDRINESKLLHQEYIVIESLNLRNQQIECTVRTGDTILTGAKKKTLKFISGETPVKVFTGKVGDTGAFDTEHGADEYVNLDTFADKAVIKLGLRPEKETTYNDWVHNLQDSAEKKARLELMIQPKNRGIFVFYGPEKAEEEPENTPHSFLMEDNTKFTIGYFDKTNHPRVSSADISKKVVNGQAVDFTPISDSFLGKRTYVLLETEHLQALQPVKCFLQAGNDVLTGKEKEALTLVWNNAGVKRLQMVKGNTEALRDQTGTDRYNNLPAFAEKTVAKLDLRPVSRAVFDSWAQNIQNDPARNAPLEISVHIVQPATNDLYIFYGKEKYEEVASNSGGVFLNKADSRFTVSNHIFYEIYHRQNLFAFLNPNTFIGKIENDSADKIATYFYHDLNDNEHVVCDGPLSSVRRRANGSKLFNTSVVANVPAGFEDSQPAPPGGDALTNYYYSNDNLQRPDFHLYDTIITIGDVNNPPSDYGIVRYRAANNNVNDQVPLLRMPDALNYTSPLLPQLLIAYTFHNTQRRYCNPECFAAFIGVLAELSLAGVQSTGMCFGDATSYPSVTHPNGDSIDQRYFNAFAFDQRDQDMITAYNAWGFTNIIRGTQQNWLAGTNSANAAHNDHLHSGNYNLNGVQLLNP